ncbi:adipocyte plasma membrane-associated protein-like [Styela clava]
MSGGDGYFRLFLCLLVGIGLVIGSALIIYAKRSPIEAVPISGIHDIRQFKWAQVENKDLQLGKIIAPDIQAPESIAIDSDDNLYTGLEDGRVVKIENPGEENQTITDLTKSFDFAKGSKRSKKRPLGIRLHGSKLYFADAYQGVIMINLESTSYEVILRYDDVTPHLVFPDDLTITSDGKTIFFTDMSLKWAYEEIALFALEGECSGRLFKVDVETTRTELVRDGLCHPNGIEIDRNDSKVLVAEHNRRRIAIIDTESGKALGEKGVLGLFSLNQGIAVKLDEDFEPVSIHYDLEGKLSKAITEISELSDGRLAVGSFVVKGIPLVDPLPSD